MATRGSPTKPLLMLALCFGCTGSDPSEPVEPAPNEEEVSDDVEVPSTYVFDSRFGSAAGTDFSDARGLHASIQVIVEHIRSSDEVDYLAAPEDFLDVFEAALGSTDDPTSLRSALGLDRPSTLTGYAGNDLAPSSVAMDMLARYEELIANRARGGGVTGSDQLPMETAYISPEGLDLAAMVETFLTGVVSYGRSADRWLDDDAQWQGLLADNVGPVVKNREVLPYTPLERSWDRAFGVFGLTPSGDTGIGHAELGLQRDEEGGTDFTPGIFRAFLEGRTLIVNADGPLAVDTLNTLAEIRSRLMASWERVIAASTVQELNALLRLDRQNDRPEEFAYRWSKSVAFGLVLQLNPRYGRFTAEVASAFHAALGEAPLPIEERLSTEAVLRAREIIVDTYGFQQNFEDQ